MYYFRDVISLIIVLIYLVFLMVAVEKINIWVSISFLVLYIIYIIIVVMTGRFTKSPKKLNDDHKEASNQLNNK
jgi:Ca2+/Na+ antiporter